MPPVRSSRARPSWVRLLVLALIPALTSALFAVVGLAQPAGAVATNIDFQQCSNENPTLGNCVWINGELNQNNSQWFEGMSVPQRVLLTGITGSNPGDPPGTHVLTFSHQATKSNVHAYDFLTSWAQASQAHQDFLGVPLTLNECGPSFTAPGLDAACATATNSFSVDVPDDPYLSAIPVFPSPYQTRIDEYEAVYGNRTITIKGDAAITGATLTLAHDTANGGDTGGDGERITYTLTYTSTSSTVLVEFAAHLAVSVGLADWGPGVGAASVPGSSNDVALTMDTFDGMGGLQTNPIHSNAISTSISAINITKIVQGVVSDQVFDFTFNPPGDGTPPAPFTLTDGQTQPFPNLSPGVFVVTETGETGFDLSSITCDEGALVTTSIPSVPVPGSAGSVVITLRPNETVNCTFTNLPENAVPTNIINIRKVVEGPNPTNQSFDFTVNPAINNTTAFALLNGQTQTFDANVGPGVFVVTEPGETGFQLISVECSPGGVGSVVNGTATITILGDGAPAQVVTCVFTNRAIPGGGGGGYGTDPRTLPTERPYDPTPGSEPAGDTGQSGGDQSQPSAEPTTSQDGGAEVAGTTVVVTPVSAPSDESNPVVDPVKAQVDLPRTGAELIQQAIAGLLLIGGGLVLMALRRRRSSSTPA